tara:strand:- start:370 stop:1788 length:1419 start_codon:yes stop_codon:yes gene_type:complete
MMKGWNDSEAITRRQMLSSSAGGFGQLVLAAMVGGQSLRGEPRSPGRNPVRPHLPGKAKRLIFLFMWGGPSHVDLFDPKPLLNRMAGKTLMGKDVGVDRGDMGNLLGSPFQFSQHGDSGIWMTEHLPHLAKQADKLCVVRSVHTEGQAHGEALLRLHTGQANLVRPSVGAWVSYGLGRSNENLPAFVTVSPPRGHGGVQNYGSAFLPSIHQGMAIGSAEIPIEKARISHLTNASIGRTTQRRQLDFIQSLNAAHLQQTKQDQGIEGLIENYELAFRMQTTLPAMLGLEDERQATLDHYGVGSEPTDNFARQCLLARKLAESGVRYIQVSTDYTWDHHQKVEEGTIRECAKVDQPIAALLEDLDQRGLLEETLVLWGGEFGRTPTAENEHGRNHHPQGFTVWMAGGGVRPGLTYGRSDAFGYQPVENPVHMHDLHATLLHALGIDHERLTYRHAGRDFRLTDVSGRVVHEWFA